MKKYTITERKLVEQLYTYEVEAETEEEALKKCENTESSIEDIGLHHPIKADNFYYKKVIDEVEELEDEECKLENNYNTEATEMLIIELNKFPKNWDKIKECVDKGANVNAKNNAGHILKEYVDYYTNY